MSHVSMLTEKASGETGCVRAFALACAVFFLSCGGAPISPADARDSARQEFELGKAAYNREDFRVALAHFEAAQALVFHPVTAQAIAECKARLGDVDGAVIVLRALLASQHKLVLPERIEDRIAELQWRKTQRSDPRAL